MKITSMISFFRILPLCSLAFIVSLTACAGLLDPGTPPVRLQLSPVMPQAMAVKPLDKQLTVAAPLAGREVDSDRIALIFNSREVRSLADARWTGTVPSLVQRGLIDAIQATKALRGVSNESAGIIGDARLISDVNDFSLHYPTAESLPTAVFSITLRVIDLNSGKIQATRTIEEKTPASGKDATALVSAMENALGKGLAEAAPWVVESLKQIKF